MSFFGTLAALAIVVGIACMVRSKRRKARESNDIIHVCRQCEHPYSMPDIPRYCRRCGGPVDKPE
jgi:rRNA maturation endonuclease Nob1